MNGRSAHESTVVRPGAEEVRAGRVTVGRRRAGYRPSTDTCRERGSASVTACLALVALLTLTVLVTQLGAVVVTRHRAQAAADLAALAAAGELRNGAGAGCAVAESLGRRMAMGVARCEVDGWDVVVEVEEKVPVGPFGARSIRAIARAGPVEEQ
ncbi:Rv3654c family TadE-like protein [Nocardia sp. NPDC019395]|uniref:Rv3654c family TadE-like protein n=1 Tax=Nocardia sp. NPDC019395 TaxID=3154686 RepID=UPI0033CC02A2